LSFAFASVSGIVAIPSSYALKTGSIRAECGAGKLSYDTTARNA